MEMEMMEMEMEMEGGEEGTMTMMPVFHHLFELPGELFLQVLTRFPIKYLIRLRCVCKRLLDLTSNPDFISFYHLRSKSNPNLLLDFNFINTVPRRPYPPLLLSPPPPPPPPDSCSIDVTNLWRFHIVIKGSNFIYLGKQRHELIPFRCPDHKHLMSCSSNGLICFSRLNFLEIFNILSGANYLVESNMKYSNTYVFGFDPISNDYKIVSFETQLQWSMFSFRTNSWKPLLVNHRSSVSTIWSSSSSSNSRRGDQGSLPICINGVIYWPLHPQDLEDLENDNLEEEERGIGFASFNLHQEKLVGIKPPPLDSTIQYSDLRLLPFRGCPCFAYMKRSRQVKTTTTTTTKSRKGSGVAEEEEETSHSGVEGDGGCRFRVELFILKNSGGGDNVEEENNLYWIRESIVTPFWFPKEVQIVPLYDQIFLAWFEAKHLRLYNLHTKCFFKLPRSPPGVYYPKVSRIKTKHIPTYVENLRFDFSLI